MKRFDMVKLFAKKRHLNMNVTKCVCINRANGADNLPMCDVDAVAVPSVDVENFLVGILVERK